MKLVGNFSKEGCSVVEDCVQENKDVSFCSYVSETSGCIILHNNETILPPKEFLDSQRVIVGSLIHTKPTHLMSKQSTKEQSTTPTVGMGSDNNMGSSNQVHQSNRHLGYPSKSSSTISIVVKVSNKDVESSKVSSISPHSTSK